MRAATQPALSSWQNELDVLGSAAMETLSARGDWQEIDGLMQTYTKLLHQPPAVQRGELAPAYRAAEILVTRLTGRARSAHEKTGQDVRQLGRGRKAVGAYR